MRPTEIVFCSRAKIRVKKPYYWLCQVMGFFFQIRWQFFIIVKSFKFIKGDFWGLSIFHRFVRGVFCTFVFMNKELRLFVFYNCWGWKLLEDGYNYKIHYNGVIRVILLNSSEYLLNKRKVILVKTESYKKSNLYSNGSSKIGSV